MKKLLLLTILCVALSSVAFGFLGFGGKKSDLTDLQKEAKKVIRAKNIRVVIGSKSTGGDTYQSSSIVAEKLGKVLGKNVKVDAVGAFSAFDAVDRVKDGSTIMIFHDQSYLGYLYGTTGYRDIFNEFKIGPTLSINPGNGFSASKNSEYNTPQDVIDAAGNGKKIRVAIQPGGVSEIGYTALKNAVKLQYPGMEKNVIAVNTGSQSDKNQQLFDGLADLIHVSVQANEQFNHLPASDQKAMKFIWLTASAEAMKELPEKGFGSTTKEELLKFGEPNIIVKRDANNNFVFDKDFFVIYNKNMKTEIIDLYDKAFAEVFADENTRKTLKNAFFIPNYKNSNEALKYLKTKANNYEEVIEAIK